MFREALGEALAPGNHAKLYNYMQFQGLGPFGAESISGSAFGRVLACIWADLVLIGAPIGSLWASVSASGGYPRGM